MNQAAEDLASSVVEEYAERSGESIEVLGTRINNIIGNRPLLDILAGMMSGEDQCAMAQKQLDALAAFNSEQKKAGREKWLAIKAEKFGELNWKAALAGSEVLHKTTIGMATYSIKLPSGQRTREAQNLHSIDLPPDQNEQVVLSWLHSIQLEGQEAQNLSATNITELLGYVRKLPTLTLAHIADECADLEQWLNLTMESELKNS